MAKSKKKKKEHAPKYTLEPFTIEEWNKIIMDHLCAGSKPLCIETEWLEIKNGTLWPHKVVRE